MASLDTVFGNLLPQVAQTNTSSKAGGTEGRLGENTIGFLNANSQQEEGQANDGALEFVDAPRPSEPLGRLRGQLEKVQNALKSSDGASEEDVATLIAALAEFEAETGAELLEKLETLVGEMSTGETELPDLATAPDRLAEALTAVIAVVQIAVAEYSMAEGAGNVALTAANDTTKPSVLTSSAQAGRADVDNLIATMRVQVGSDTTESGTTGDWPVSDVPGFKGEAVVSRQDLNTNTVGNAASPQVANTVARAQMMTPTVVSSVPVAAAMGRVEGLRAMQVEAVTSETATDVEPQLNPSDLNDDAATKITQDAARIKEKEPSVAMMTRVLSVADQLSKTMVGASVTDPQGIDIDAIFQSSTGSTVDSLRPEEIMRSLTAPSFEVRDAVLSGQRLDAEQKTPATPRFTAALTSQIQAAEVSEGRTRIELTPAGLGTVEIDVSTDADGAVQIVVRAESAAVLSALRDERDLLAQILGDSSSGSLEFQEYTSGSEQEGASSEGNHGGHASGDGLVEDESADQDVSQNVIDGSQLDIVA